MLIMYQRQRKHYCNARIIFIAVFPIFKLPGGHFEQLCLDLIENNLILHQMMVFDSPLLLMEIRN